MRSRLFASRVPKRSTQSTKVAVGRIWPNGEFSLGYVSEGEEVFPCDDRPLRECQPPVEPDDVGWCSEQLEAFEEEAEGPDFLNADPGSRSVTLSDAYNSHKPPPRAAYGLKGLSAKGRKMIRNGAYLLEKVLGKEDCTMITLTVPTLEKAARVVVAKKWGVLTNRLVQYLTRELLSQGRKPAIIGCVEIQTGRLAKYGQGYLHLHLICPAHSNAGRFWAIEASALRAWWAEALERVIGHSLPHLPRVETAIVTKSVEAYLAKYLSKGTGEELAAFVADVGEECLPGQWWFCSAPMREAIVEKTISGRNCGALLESMIEHLLEQGTGEGFVYIRHVDRTIGNQPVTCGWIGRLTPELRSELELILAV